MAIETAIFAGGCFWCMVEPFDKMSGIEKVISGYTGGTTKNPTYLQVSQHTTGHVEAVKIWFDNTKISYDELLDIYWMISDPTDNQGQFADRGDSYKPIIFTNSIKQREHAEISKAKLNESKRFDLPIVTEIRDTKEFYIAEEEHQDFYKKNPFREHMMMRPRKRFQERFWTN
ncbi:Peptide methionine sulfoxide reductase MsrA [Leuconostoc inhae]|jgi:peptide-methionine (S)-S-oxide reductase|uniref:peptide-methionine (S)-S-oxide reductase MsrA n=1 Tax=Leuconostoc TaxID=1243 RepID=UPI0007E0B1FF|nr:MULTISPECIES: peptide-methionine (S)-S-oxide reductase MsrA [Leuconostoc]MBZ5979780.1 peptide-methionine (S)-S-oxide reductase MsrA [Leuconostoc gasicomitatum]MBZ5994812.1 peptide-methionine (S)-S-oxide reductase MsrA [Leuconostoc gasicomitatum]MBZ5995871.1 peptide-methionine (S)-S-oxide reductase MsrA [Leuconostoc gasicomitatum]MBZ5997300.1 peptide-methionine (S)-S-oxide reductase MsrA [Leuconostoc gasicomitatum]CUW10949.1 Peptide methionine sulfoxide reductase MsrA [Leuconostoc inhae]